MNFNELLERGGAMDVNSYTITKYSFQELEWNEIWDTHSGLEHMMEKATYPGQKQRIERMINEILRITDTPKRR